MSDLSDNVIEDVDIEQKMNEYELEVTSIEEAQQSITNVQQ